MIVSLNEVDVSAKRAARGVGLSWGLAEEAGKAVRFLCARGLPGVDALLPLLGAYEGLPPGAASPDRLSGNTRGAGSFLCPIVAGAALSDDPAAVPRASTIVFHNVRAPLLLLPFLSRAARKLHVSLSGDGTDLRLHAMESGEVAASGSLCVELCAELAVSRVDGLADVACRTEGTEPVHVDDAVWAALQKFAARTYVPASEKSRLMGAGAGLLDND